MSTQVTEVSLSLRTPQLTPFSAPGGYSALRVWGAFALLMMLVAVPLFSTVLPPLFDYPNHLARMYLLSEGGDAYYAVRWAPLPNLAQDLIVPPLIRLMPLEIASKLFLVMIFGLIVSGAIWLNRAGTGACRLFLRYHEGRLLKRQIPHERVGCLFAAIQRSGACPPQLRRPG